MKNLTSENRREFINYQTQLQKLYMNGTFIYSKNSQPSVSKRKFVGNICFSEQIFYRKQYVFGFPCLSMVSDHSNVTSSEVLFELLNCFQRLKKKKFGSVLCNLMIEKYPLVFQDYQVVAMNNLENTDNYDSV